MSDHQTAEGTNNDALPVKKDSKPRAKRVWTPEQKIAAIAAVQKLLSKGLVVKAAAKKVGVAESTYNTWMKKEKKVAGKQRKTAIPKVVGGVSAADVDAIKAENLLLKSQLARMTEKHAKLFEYVKAVS